MALTLSSSPARSGKASTAGVTAVLGPTNTGKTHLAIERMLAHSSGAIGLPLRLLAREVFNKIVDRVGPEAVALVTGEEKIKPAHPRYWVATMEAMPRDLDVAFVAIDEIQLGADLERGHVFTDRMLNRRGREETLILGAHTMRPIVEKLLPGAHILSRPRLSQLTHAGDRKITRLPRRSAIVAFSADEVYAIAELIRRQRGGAAVVLGALSPRTRNAQVELYQSGDIDYLVATDAIGMGLNLDVDHVAFASDRKFDGYQFRRLNPAEFAQIAGRAGRATRDGTFGTTGRCEPFAPELVQALESHNFESVKVLQWRNTELEFSSLAALQASLAVVPEEQGLTRAPTAEDIRVLEHASRDDEVRALATTKGAIERLWEASQLPDYRKISPSAHSELVITLYRYLEREGRLPADWFARQVAQNDRTDGDIDTLSARIAHIRTWTFAANRPDWLEDPEHWQGVTRGVEDKLSDALHERLLSRFVDRRTSVLMRRLRENAMLETEIGRNGEVLVEGHPLGRLEGFRFLADTASAASDGKALRAAASKALAGEIDARAAKLAEAGDEQIVLASDGALRWLGDPVAKLGPGDDVLRPQVRIIADEYLTGASREAVQARLDTWIKAHIEKLLGPLLALGRAEDVTGIARGIAFQLVEALGVLERAKVVEEVRGLDPAARAALRKYGVRFGAYHLYLPALLKPAPRALAMQLWALKHAEAETKGLEELPHLAASGRTSMPADKDVPKALYRTVGYRVCGERAVRVDILERLADLIRPALAWRPGAPGGKPAGAVDGSSFQVTGGMTSLVGSSGEDFASILRSLGYRMERRPKPAEEPPPATAEAAVPVAPEHGEASVNPAGVAAEGEAAGEVPSAPDEAAPATPAGVGAELVPDILPAPEFVAATGAGSPGPAADPVGAAYAAAAPADIAEADAEAASGPAEAGAHASAPIETGSSTAVDADPVGLGYAAAEPADVGEADAGAVSGPGDGSVPADAATAPTQDGTPEAPEPAAEAAPAEPVLIEVWRPGRFEHAQGPRRSRAGAGKPARHHGPRAPSQPAEASASPASARAEPQRERPENGQRGRPGKDGRPGKEERHFPRRAERAHGEAERPHKGEHGPRHGGKGQGRSAFVPHERAERREKAPDPNSPFAKLLALKEQLQANAKDRR